MKRATSDTIKLNSVTAHKRGAPKGPRKADMKKAFLIEVAEKIFIEKGYESATMDDIAGAAGFAKGTLYHYFANKAELLQVLRDDFDKKISDRISERVHSVPENDWPGRIEAWIEAAVKAYFDLNELHDVVVYGAGLPFRNAMANSKITKFLAELLKKGNEAGAWNVEDERWTAVMMFYSYRGGCDEAMVGSQKAEAVPEKLKDLFFRILGLACSNMD